MFRKKTSAADGGQLFVSLDKNVEAIGARLGFPMDLKTRELRPSPGGPWAAVIHLEGIVDAQVVYDQIVKGIAFDAKVTGVDELPPKALFRRLSDQIISVTGVRIEEKLDDVVAAILAGDAIVLVDGASQALACSARGYESRRVSEPENESVVRGPREGFTETLQTNRALIRRRLQDPRLRMEGLAIGSRTKTAVAVAYVEDIADPDLVREVMARLRRIDSDAILESGYIEEYIEDSPWSPFPQMARTERSDVVVAALLEGRVAILVDGTPFALLAPVVFWQLLISAEDYYERWFIGSFIRLLRVIMFSLSLVLPSLYVAVTTFHQELLPTPLVLSIAAQREGVPFPAVVEALGMEIAFEMLREAGLRLPRTVGQAVSIVGALVIGEAAVQAGLVAPAMVIVVAATGIASFSAPAFNLAISARLLRFPILIAAATLGLFGVGIVVSLILAHLASLRSFGVPYMAPLAPFHGSDMKDLFVRAPRWSMWSRPRLTGAGKTLRQPTELTPERGYESRD